MRSRSQPTALTYVEGTWAHGRFPPNLIFRLVYQLLITLPKIILIGPQGPVPPIVVKSVYWDLEPMKRPIESQGQVPPI